MVLTNEFDTHQVKGLLSYPEGNTLKDESLLSPNPMDFLITNAGKIIMF